MTHKKYAWMILAAAVLLSSCDLLGIGGDDKNEESGPALLWKINATGGAIGSPPIIEDENLYLRGFELMKVGLKAGSKEWTVLIEEGSNLPDYLKRMLVTGQAVVAGQPERIKAFRKSDGQVLWEIDTGFSFNDAEPSGAGTFLLAYTSGRIFAAYEQELIGLDTSTGNREVTIMLDGTGPGNRSKEITALTAGKGAAPLLFAATRYTIDDGWTDEGRVIALDSRNGRTVWSVEVSDTPDDNIAPAPRDLLLADGLLVVLTGSGAIALEPASGKMMWQTALDEGGSRLLAGGNAIFINSYSGTIYRLDSRNGSVQWKISALDSPVGFDFEPLVWDSGYLYYPNLKSNVFGISIIDAENGKTERFLTASDIRNVEFDFGFMGSMSVRNSYMVRQGGLNTYGIKF
ncbi:MAG TPA: PQQ-binding-like beta-propeller repeat protein [Fodinibius sp.]|nr:PQQ-binding-like beta-propeller repeat protein [Fodinibius sp.]